MAGGGSKRLYRFVVELATVVTEAIVAPTSYVFFTGHRRKGVLRKKRSWTNLSNNISISPQKIIFIYKNTIEKVFTPVFGCQKKVCFATNWFSLSNPKLDM